MRVKIIPKRFRGIIYKVFRGFFSQIFLDLHAEYNYTDLPRYSHCADGENLLVVLSGKCDTVRQVPLPEDSFVVRHLNVRSHKLHLPRAK